MGSTINQLFKHYFLAASLFINAMHIKDSDSVHLYICFEMGIKGYVWKYSATNSESICGYRWTAKKV